MPNTYKQTLNSIFGRPAYVIVTFIGFFAVIYLTVQSTRATGLPAQTELNPEKIQYAGNIYVRIVPGLYQREDMIDTQSNKKYEEIRHIFASTSNEYQAPPKTIKVFKLGKHLAHATSVNPPTSFDKCNAAQPKSPKKVTFICLSPVDLNRSRNKCTTTLKNENQVTAC